MTSIYKAPDIRKQTILSAEKFINQKRVRRLLMATKHREVVLNKAIKYHDQAAERFDRNVDLINKAMERIIDLLDKTDNRISLLIKLNTEMTNLEAVIENEGG